MNQEETQETPGVGGPSAVLAPVSDAGPAIQASERLSGLRDLSPPAPLAVGLSRYARAHGQRDVAVQVVENSLRNDGWHQPKLWYELVSLMAAPSDYRSIRELWWSSPAACHEDVLLLKAVARAACIAGAHEEGRTLVRKAILQEVRRRSSSQSSIAKLRDMRERSDGSPGRSSDRTFQAKARIALQDLTIAFEAMGVRSFIISGTLLGLIRDDGIIPWDKDIDMGVFSEAIDPRELEDRFARNDRFSVRRVDLSSDRLRVSHQNGVWVDVFPHYRGARDRIWHDGSATRWWNTPFGLRKMEFLGLQVDVPDPPERYLDENYGDWRVPDRNFDARIDAPNVEVTDRPYFDSLQFFSLFDAIRGDNEDKTERYVGLLRQQGEVGWIDRI